MGIDIEYFLTDKGQINGNWKKLILKDPSKFDRSQYSDELDDKTVLNLAVRGLTELPLCKTCGKTTKIDTVFCSRKCSANDPEVKAKQISSVDQVAKGKKTSAALKGRNDYHDKCWETRREKYGIQGTTFAGMESIKSRKPAQDHIPPWVYDKGEFIRMYDIHGFDKLMDIIGCHFTFMYRITLEYGIRTKSRSIAEDELSDFIKSFGVHVDINRRDIIPPKELDIYVPTHNLAIEYDGIFWHSSCSLHTDKEISTAHISKTNLCEEQGIHLLHIFEDEWKNPIKQEIWKSVIAHKLGKSKKLYARKCELRDVDKHTANEFCARNHLQGAQGHSFALGLFYNDELVQVATFGTPRYDKSREFELIRLCSKLNTCVVGGASKLLKGKSFVSYANRRWSFGNVYDSVGLEKVRVTPPNYFYIVDGQLKHRSGYMKHVLHKKLEVFDSSKSEYENCYANGLRRIWDCGNILYMTTETAKGTQ